MADRPPKYVDITTALATKGPVNVIAVVVDVLGGAWKSQGTSSCITFTIKDSNFNNGHTWDGLKIKYFNDIENLLPPVQVGDVILLRNIWVKVFHGRPLGVAAQDRTAPWAVFRPDRDPTSQLSALTGPVPFEPSYTEKSYALTLQQVAPVGFRNASSSTKPNPAPPSLSKPSATTQGKFALLQDVQDRQFVDLIGEIVKIYGNDSEKATIYLTDYTANPKFFSYTGDDGSGGREGDPCNYIPRQNHKWKGPFGQMSIQITLWEPHASHVREHFKENDIVRLKNVRIKGSRVESTLEGILHTNRDSPEAVNAFPVDASKDDRVRQLFSRRAEYWKANPPKHNPEPEPKKPKKNKAKKTSAAKPEPKIEEGQKPLEFRESITSPYVMAGKPGIPSRSLEWILDDERREIVTPNKIQYTMPFQNVCYCTTVRVLDFFPPLLEDFAVPADDGPGTNENTQSQPSRKFIRWEWRFVLLVESFPPPPSGQPRQYMELYVFGPDAVFLLQEDPADLRENKTLLEKIRTKLWHLWGDLEEKKRTALNNTTGHNFRDLGPIKSRPFNCCIKEYGIKCEHPPNDSVQVPDDMGMPTICGDDTCFGWEKKFAITTTTIA